MSVKPVKHVSVSNNNNNNKKKKNFIEISLENLFTNLHTFHYNNKNNDNNNNNNNNNVQYKQR